MIKAILRQLMPISLPDFTILQINHSFIIEIDQNKSFHIFSSAVYVNYKCSNLWLYKIQLDWMNYTKYNYMILRLVLHSNFSLDSSKGINETELLNLVTSAFVIFTTLFLRLYDGFFQTPEVFLNYLILKLFYL